MPPADLLRPLLAFGDHFVPAEFRDDPELFRKSRLIVNFGIQSGFFGLVYAIFYLAIGHFWGAGLVLLCTTSMLAVGLSRSRNLLLAGNLHALIMTLGFIGLAAIEGGVEGHAVSWLATIPISALVLADQKSGLIWLGLVFTSTAVFSTFFGLGIHVPILYPHRWHTLVTASGYVSLTLFASILGFIFENGRRHAHRRMEHALRNLTAANQILARLNQEKSDMMQVVAHDLKSPLQAILGHAGLIDEGYVTETIQVQSSARQIVVTSRRMTNLINDLLDINAIEEGKFNLSIEDFDLNQLVREAVSHHQFAADSKRIHLDLRLGKPPPQVRAARNPTVQVLDNLLSNSIKYSPEGRAVHIRVLSDGHRGTVEVCDEGPGLSEDDQQKLFQKFTKLTARPTGGESSTGLGLSIAKKITEAMGGRIGCHSVLGAGATFFIELPGAGRVR